MPLIGLRDVESVLAAARPGDYGAKILRYWRDWRPFVAMMKTSMNRRKARDPRLDFFQQDVPSIRAYINNVANYAAGDTSIDVDDGAGNGMARLFRKGDVLRYAGTAPGTLHTGELLRVTADPTSATTLTVARGLFGTTAAAMNDNCVLIKIGDGQAEAGLSPTPVYNEPSDEYNYIEIFRDSWSITAQMENTQTRFGEPEAERLATEALWQHCLKQEMAAFYGTRGTEVDSDTATTIRKMGGFVYFLPAAQIHDGSGASFTAANIASWVSSLTYGSPEKVCFCGATAYRAWQQYAKSLGTVFLQPQQEQFGFRMTTLITDGPTIHFKVHPLLTQYAPGDSHIMDMAYCTEGYWTDFKKEAIPIANTVEQKKWQFRSERTYTWGNPNAHTFIYGVTVYT